MFRTLKPPTLKSEVTVVEFVTALTAAAVAIACMYNWGFFSALGGSLASLLTIPDLLIGAAVSAIPTAFLLGGGLLWAELIPQRRQKVFSAEETLKKDFQEIGSVEGVIDKYERVMRSAAIKSFIVAVLLTIASFVWVAEFASFIPQFQVVLAFFACLAWVMTAISNRANDVVKLAVIIVGLSSVAFVTGRSVYFSAINSDQNDSLSVTLTSGKVLSGRLLRATSSHWFILVKSTVYVLPEREVSGLAISANDSSMIEQIIKNNTVTATVSGE